MKKKIIIIGMALIMGLILFGGCDSDYKSFEAVVCIKAEFREKFLAENFSEKDFEWNNVKSIEYVLPQYTEWFSQDDAITDPPVLDGYIRVYLKEHGKKNAEATEKRFSSLAFVHSVKIELVVALINKI